MNQDHQERPFSYLLAVAQLVEAVQRIHRTEPRVAPLTLEQVHFWLRQVTLDDLQDSVSAAQQKKRMLGELLKPRQEEAEPPRVAA